jgi:SAM-dependent methyltransferase
VKAALLELLQSPFDGSRLGLDEPEWRDGEIVAGSLVDESENRFPIAHGVPLFAEADAADETFEFKWRRIGAYGHEEATREGRQQWYLERFGFDSRAALTTFLSSQDLVLDAGAGSGVDSAMFSESDATVVAVDLSREAAAATYRHLRSRPNVHVLQADINRLPFPEGLFGYISSDQVLHHTPDTRTAFRSLARHLRPGGRIAIYVYRRKGPIREFVDDYLRARTTKMSVEECYEFCRTITLLGKALADLRADLVVPESVPLLELEAGAQDVQRFLYWNVLKCFWNEDYDFETNVIVNFDWYHPRYAFRHDPPEVRRWYEELGLELERLDVVPSGISGVGRLPASET